MSERSSGDQPQGDDTQAYERALQHQQDKLPGDTAEDRNLSGSTTYETLPDQQGDEGPSGKDGGQS
jgi:hypothetical protein